MFRWVVTLLIAALVGTGCNKSSDPVSGGSETATQMSNSAQIFSDSVASLSVKVFYEPSAAPYVGNLGTSTNPVWSITRTSLQALFQNHIGRFIFMPTTLGQMTALAAQGKGSWSAADLMALARKSAPNLVEDRDVTLSVFFLNGTYNGDGSVLGLQLTGYPVAFVFKDMLSVVGGDATQQRYVEQATVLHHLSHAMGLINNGVPMAVNHEDIAHPHHTTNPKCVMAYSIENKSTVLSTLGTAITNSQLQLYGAESLSDARTFHP